MAVDRTAVAAHAGVGVHPRLLLWASGAAVAVVAVWLWVVQLQSLTAPCAIPECVWPRLSVTGFSSLAELGISPWGWTVIAGGLSLVWAGVPFLLGVAVVRSGAAWWLGLLWFGLALGTLSAVPASPVLVAILRAGTLGCWFSLFALFPSGRFRPRWVAFAPIVAVCWTIVLSLPVAREAETANDPLWWSLESAVYVVCVAAIVVAQIVQFVRADATERRALRLLLLPLGLFAGFGVVTAVLNARLDAESFGYGTLGGAALYELSSFLTIMLIACIAVATLRDDAYGVRIAVDRLLVAAVALTVAAAVYAVVTVAASVVVSGWLASALAAVITAVALAGVFGRLARGIGRLVYGDADDPAAVAAALDARVAEASAPEQLLPGIAATLAGRLRFPGLRVTLRDSDAAPGLAGVLTGSTARVPLTLDDRPLGEIEVALRPGQRRLSHRDRAALAAASGPVAAAGAARRLNEELRRSRLEVLISRDEERRSLRRRLHDEVGPTLALAGHRITAARDDPAQLDAASRTVADAVAQVRAISRELRPPALDELGLRAAIAAFAEGLSLPAEVTAPQRILPGVLEVAAYRIAVEALLNVSRHADASHAIVAVCLEPDGWAIQVDDDGSGLSPQAVPGVGIHAMRERAEELGGSVSVGSSKLGGTRVRAVLPAPLQEPIS